MPQYSPIAPVHLLQQLQDQNKLGNYLLLLAHDIIDHPEAYVELLFELYDLYQEDAFIILDNGVIEKGEPVPLGDLLTAADLVNPSCVVSPDVLGNYVETKKLAIQQVPKIMEQWPVMFIPQGRTHAELCECADWMYQSFAGDYYEGMPVYWGIPRWVANKQGSRLPLIRYLAHNYSPCKMHLLGMSKKLRDDFICLKQPYIMGIDSANPLVLGREEIEMYEFMEYEHLERGNYWEMPRLTGCMAANVEWMHHVVAS